NEGPNAGSGPQISAPRGVPAPLLGGPEPQGPGPDMHVDKHMEKPNEINELQGVPPVNMYMDMHVDGHTGLISTLTGRGPGEFGNGAPVGPVTVTPTPRGRSALLGPDQRGPSAPLDWGV